VSRLDALTGRKVEGGHRFAEGQRWRRKSDGVVFVVMHADEAGLAAHMWREGRGPDQHEFGADWISAIYYSTDIEPLP
jgi:hypothetical protein